MQYIDSVYSTFDITDLVILELIASPEFHRLRDIDSGGYPYPFFPNGKTHSRFDHSVGVYLLLKRYNASLEEQIAGLIHDVSHSAFSHAIDYVLEGGKGALQDHQDNVFDAFVRRSGIPAILTKYGFDVDFILDDRHFPLKETDLPDLCADRLDYSLRHAVLRFGRDAKREFLLHLHVDDRRWVFDSAVSARAFADYFRQMNAELTAGFPSAVMFTALGDLLRHAMAKEYVTYDDLYTTDTAVLTKVRAHAPHDSVLRQLFDRLEGRVPYRNDPHEYDAKVVLKSRIVDPLCLHEGRVVRLSDVQSDWGEIVHTEMQPKEYFIKWSKLSFDQHGVF